MARAGPEERPAEGGPPGMVPSGQGAGAGRSTSAFRRGQPVVNSASSPFRASKSRPQGISCVMPGGDHVGQTRASLHFARTSLQTCGESVPGLSKRPRGGENSPRADPAEGRRSFGPPQGHGGPLRPAATTRAPGAHPHQVPAATASGRRGATSWVYGEQRGRSRGGKFCNLDGGRKGVSDVPHPPVVHPRGGRRSSISG